jgi:hypothetical protein
MGTNDACLRKLFSPSDYCLAARLDTALAHLFPIDDTGPQDSVTIQYKKLLRLTVLAREGESDHDDFAGN